MHTLRARLLLGTAVGTSLVLLIFGVLLYGLFSAALWREFDDSLATKVRSLASLVEQDEEGIQLEFTPQSFPEFNPSAHAEYFQLWSGGQTVARSASLGGDGLEPTNGDLDVLSYRMLKLPDGRPGRGAALNFLPRQESENGHAKQSGPPLRSVFLVERETSGVEGTLARLRLLLAALCVVAILASVGILAGFVRRGLRPVGHLAAQIANVGEGELDARINADHIPAELMPVVERLNELLARLEAAFNRERVFTADVAHELRTPLAGLRAMLEVAASREREPQEYHQTLTGCLAVSQQMQQMVVNLLNLARAEARQLPVASEPVELTELVRECWKPLAPASDERRLRVDWRMPQPVTLNTDRSKIQLILTNLLDNAVTYADPGGQVTIQTTAENGCVELHIANTGSQVPADQVAHVFDRFWRGDASRCAAGQHCGLGLSLCKKLISLLGGSISASSALSGTFEICIVLPRGG